MRFSTDDICPQNIEGQFCYFDRLKERHPDFRIIGFTTAKWLNNKNNLISENKDFLNFCNERKDWLRLAYHGLYHNKNTPDSFEGKMPIERQIEYLTEMIRIFNDFKKEYKGIVYNIYKPPYYRWNSDMFVACEKVGIEYAVVQDGVLNIETATFKSRIELGLLDSHTNPATDMPDRIDKIYEKFDELLSKDGTKFEFK